MTILENRHLKKDSTLIFILNTCVYFLFFFFGYIGILRFYYSSMILNLNLNYTLRQNIYSIILFMGLEMDAFSILLFYFSILILCVINLITLIKYVIKKSNLEKYYIGKYSQLIFLPLILFSCLNFLGYQKLKENSNFSDIYSDKKLIISLCFCIIGLIILGVIYYFSFIRNNDETNEESPNYLLKIFYEVLLIFYLYYFFHLVQLFRLKNKIKDEIYDIKGEIPKKFQIVMASIIETIFGLIGLVIIFFGKSFVYAFYQIYIYIAFLIIRADIGKIENEPYYISIKLNVYDYIISVIMISLTVGCVIYLLISIRKSRKNIKNDI